jgi:TolA-binding protein
MLFTVLVFLFSTGAKAAQPVSMPPVPPVLFGPTATAQVEPASNTPGPGGEGALLEEKEGEDKPAAPSISEEQLIASSMQVAEQLYHAEDYQGAAQATQQILDRYPKTELLPTRYLNGLAQEKSGNLKEAIAMYKGILKKAPKSTYAMAANFHLGTCCMLMDDIPGAIHVFRDIIDFSPAKSDYRMQAYIHLGNLYRRASEWKLAENIYRDIIRLYPCTTWATTSIQYLAECYTHQEDEEEAIRLYRRIQKDECTPPIVAAQAQLNIGDIYMKTERYQDALKTYYQAIDKYGDIAGIRLYSEQKIELAKQHRNTAADTQIRRRNIDIRQRPED